MQNFIKTFFNAVQNWTKKEINNRVLNSKADWNENNSSKDSYVKNRPFYEQDGKIHKLDNKYLPDNVVVSDDLQDAIGKMHDTMVDVQEDIDSRILKIGFSDIEFPIENNALQSMAYGNGKFVAVGGSSWNNDISGITAYYSDDGNVWKSTTMPYNTEWNSVTYGNGKFVAVSGRSSASSYAACSEDGINWTGSNLGLSRYYASVAYGNGKFIAVGSNTSSKNNQIAYSENGIDWQTITTPVSVNWTSVTYGNGKFVAMGGGGYTNYKETTTSVAAYSEDGINWTAMYMPTSQLWESVIYGNDKFVAISSSIAWNGIAAASAAAYSKDGVNWTKITMPISQVWESITYGNGKFVAVGRDYVVSSEDGINWKRTYRHTNGYFISVTYCNDKFAGLSGGNVYYSKDGINWSKQYEASLLLNNVDKTKVVTDIILGDNVIMPPTTAQVGQVLSVKAVDENGKPTEWECVDMPTSDTDSKLPSVTEADNGKILTVVNGVWTAIAPSNAEGGLF